jgi:hypothetical protein
MNVGEGSPRPEDERLFNLPELKWPEGVELRRCASCKLMKPLEQFYVKAQRLSPVTGEPQPFYDSHCRPCKRKANALTAKWHRDGVYARLWRAQGGVCALDSCDVALPLDGKGSMGRLHLDHDHRTGAIRGLLCPNHNNGIGFFNDDPEELASAIRYLGAEVIVAYLAAKQ